MPLARVPLPDADIAFDPSWLAPDEAHALFERLLRDIAWGVHRIRLFGREVDSPRLSCWIGDADARYRYSGTLFEPHPWPSALAPVRERLSRELDVSFDSVLANRYRDGRDGMGWHRDDERELGPRPAIASLSLGAARRFVLKQVGGEGARWEAALPAGSLLVMRGETQANYRHALPKTARRVGERINLTFRRILLPHDASLDVSPRG
jgi:alkylated DNA repair dioxygenase AlkB